MPKRKRMTKGRRLLEAWRAGRPQKVVAAILGVDQGNYSGLENGTRGAGLKVALQIAERTAGAVPAESWLEEEPQDDEKNAAA